MLKKILYIKKIPKARTVYLLTFGVFVIWMLFFDMNSWLTHRELNREIRKLNKQKLFLQKEIEKDRKSLNELKTIEGKEKLGRETYYLKRDNEEIFIIEYDTIN